MNVCSKCGSPVKYVSGAYICPKCSDSSGPSTAEQLSARRAEQRESWAEYNRRLAAMTPAQRRRHEIFGNILTAVVVVIVIGALVFAGRWIDNKTGFFTNIGHNISDSVAGFFGNESAADSAEMNKIRKAKTYDNENIDISELAAKKTALEEFIASNPSYRMSGEFQYGYKTGNTFNSFITKITMSYNADLDVYKFVFTSKEHQGYNVLANEKMKNLHILDGTYYVVNEGGKTYILSDSGGEKKVTEVTGTGGVYGFLMWHSMEGVIETDFFNDKPDAFVSTGSRYQNKVIGEHGSDYYRYNHDSLAKSNYLGDKVALRTYKDMPVTYEQTGDFTNSDAGFNIKADYYYDRIPKDNPSVAEWK